MIKYQDINGNSCSLDALCVDEPAWAANRIRVLLSEGSLFREQLQNIAKLDYANAATNCAAHDAVIMARTVLGAIGTETSPEDK